nr:uncharacterized protein LOC120971594 [Aegilops tauschii subsp. strangulata]
MAAYSDDEWLPRDKPLAKSTLQKIEGKIDLDLGFDRGTDFHAAADLAGSLPEKWPEEAGEVEEGGGRPEEAAPAAGSPGLDAGRRARASGGAARRAGERAARGGDRRESGIAGDEVAGRHGTGRRRNPGGGDGLRRRGAGSRGPGLGRAVE